MDRFLQYETELPYGSGFAMWGPRHLLWLLALLLVTAAILRSALRKSHHTGLVIRRILATSALSFTVLPSIILIVKGLYGLSTLPLHICSLAGYAVFFHSLCAERSIILSEILFFPMLPGALCALLFPDWTMYPALSFFSTAGFLSHGSVIAYVLLCLGGRILHPHIRRIYIPVLFLAVYAGIMIPFDRAFGVNYGFLRLASPGSPLVWMEETFGTGIGYYISYAAAVFIVMVLWYGAWHICKGRIRGCSA